MLLIPIQKHTKGVYLLHFKRIIAYLVLENNAKCIEIPDLGIIDASAKWVKDSENICIFFKYLAQEE